MEYTYYNELLQGDKGALKRALYKAMGFTDEALGKPLIAIVNTYTNATPGHFNLNEICAQVERGIEAAGGTAMTFGSIAPCDGIAEGHEGMRYILPSRDLITSSVECMVRAHRFDGIVLLGSCDKIVPGLLMAAARLDIPAVFCNSGPMMPACYKGKHYDGNIVTEAVGWKQRGEITEEEFRQIENLAEPCAGSCAMLGTANTMGCMAEALGMSEPAGKRSDSRCLCKADAGGIRDRTGGDGTGGEAYHRKGYSYKRSRGKCHGGSDGDRRLYKRDYASAGNSQGGGLGKPSAGSL